MLRGRLVELARRLVRDEQRRRVGEGGAERDPLLLTTGELAGTGVRPVEKPDPLEQLACPTRPLAAGGAAEPEWERHQLLGGQLGGQRPPVVLIGVADHTSAVARDDVRGRRADVDAVDDRSAGRRPLEPSEQPARGSTSRRRSARARRRARRARPRA